MRPLTESEVTFDLELEPEHIPFRGNAIASGDPEYDREYEAELQERLDNGDESAWCCLTVTATWVSADGDEYAGRDHLGGVTLEGGSGPAVSRQAWELADWHGMKQKALADLNATLQARVAKCAALQTELSEQVAQ
jgi:hypothetical protein